MSACGSKSGSATDTPTSATTEAESAKEGVTEPSVEIASNEIVNLVWQLPTLGSVGSGVQAVEDALNALMEADIGVHVSFEPVSVSDITDVTALAISSGDELDIILQWFTPLQTSVEQGLILPIDEYMKEYGQDMAALLGSSLNGSYYQGQLYGIPGAAYIKGESYGYLARKDILDKYNIEYDTEKVYTLDDLEKIFAIVKEGEGDGFFMEIPEIKDIPSPGYINADAGHSSWNAGVFMLNRSFTDTTLYNLVETKEYAAYAQKMHEWTQKGYISGDAITNELAIEDLLPTGNYLGDFYWTTPNAEPNIEAATGYDLVALITTPGFSVGGSNQLNWMVPVTCKNPAKAVETINYIFKNMDAAVLLQYGMEGQDYEVLEETEEGKLIKYLADDASTLPYYMPFGIYGNRLAWPILAPSPINMNQLLKEFDEAIGADRTSPGKGYSFETASVQTQFDTVGTVMSQYAGSVHCGTMDPAQLLPEFIEALKAAGIDEVIAENQRQFDEWKAAQ
jgi:putative aldouronate transport system substrate-binding protein